MKIKIVSIILMVLMLLSVPAMAQENETELTDPGTTPDSFLYFMDVAMDNLALAMTFNDDDKIDKQLEIAEERLAEAREMAEKGDIENMQKASDEHGKMLFKLKSEVKNVDNGDSEGELEKEIKIQQKIKEHSHKIEDVKDKLKIKIEIEGNITAEQQEIIDSILASLEGQTGEVEIEIENEKSKTKIKIETETGKDGDEVETEIEDELGITEEQRNDALEEINEVQEDLNETLEDYEEMNVTPSSSLMDDINELLSLAQAAFDAGNYEEAEELAEQADDLVEELEDEIEEKEHDAKDDENEAKDHKDESDEDEVDEDEVDDDDSEDNKSKDDSSEGKSDDTQSDGEHT